MSFVINPYRFNAPAAITFTGSSVIVNTGTVFTFSAETLGTGDIVVCTSCDGNAVSGVTVDGNAATVVVRSEPSGNGVTIWRYNGNTAATGDVVVTMGTSQTQMGIGVYLLENVSSSLHDSGIDDYTSSTTVMTSVLNVIEGGVLIAVQGGNTASTMTYSGEFASGDETYDEQTQAGSRQSGAAKLVTTTGTNVNATVTMSTANTRAATAAASWAKA